MMIDDELLKRTVSNMFMVPLLKIGRPILEEHGLINSFLLNAEEDVVYENALHLLFSPPNIDRFNLFVALQKTKNTAFINELDYPGNLVVLVYQLPSKFKADYEKIWQGKFSEVSEEYKASIPSIIQLKEGNRTTNNLTIQHMVFGKLEVLRTHWEIRFNVTMENDQELWTKPTIETETFKLADYESLTRNAQRAERP